MTDLLLELGANPTARRVVKSLGLPLPLPEPLRRERRASPSRPLAERAVIVAAAPGARVLPRIAEVLAQSGADAFTDDQVVTAAFAAPGEAYGRPARSVASAPRNVNGFVLDASGIESSAALRALLDQVQPQLERLGRCARVVVVGREPRSLAVPSVAAAQAAIEGFVRSLAKEIGRRGQTANLLRVEDDGHDRLAGPLAFLLSDRCAFVSGQVLVVDRAAKGTFTAPIERPLDRKIALVTGAARGIGAATARALAADGAKVICLDRPEDEEATSKLARALGGEALLVNLTDEGAPAKIAETVARLGGLDVLVHNAGVTRDKTLARMQGGQWDGVLGVNLEAVVRVTDALRPHLRDGARVIGLSSIAGLAGNMGQTAYAASKAAIVGYVRALAVELAPRGITVNAIAPGFIETRLTAAIPIAIREVARRLSALGQGGLPEDVAAAIAFLARPDSLGITGRTLRVCGGAFVGA
jgi:3-oxoacyl-[acyl-carrier protein] reductase